MNRIAQVIHKEHEAESATSMERIDRLAEMARQLSEKDSELEAANKVIRTILASSPEALIGIDDTGRVMFFNENAETMFEWKKEEIMGRALAKIIFGLHPNGDQRKIQDSPCYRAMNEKKRLRFKSELLKRKSQSTFHADVIASPMKNGIGGAVISIRDIESEIEKKKRFLELIGIVFNAMFNGVIITTMSDIVFINNAGISLLDGMDQNDFVGKRLPDFLEKGEECPPLSVCQELSLISFNGDKVDVEYLGLPFDFGGEESVLHVFKSRRS